MIAKSKSWVVILDEVYGFIVVGPNRNGKITTYDVNRAMDEQLGKILGIYEDATLTAELWSEAALEDVRQRLGGKLNDVEVDEDGNIIVTILEPA